MILPELERLAGKLQKTDHDHDHEEAEAIERIGDCHGYLGRHSEGQAAGRGLSHDLPPQSRQRPFVNG